MHAAQQAGLPSSQTGSSHLCSAPVTPCCSFSLLYTLKATGRASKLTLPSPPLTEYHHAPSCVAHSVNCASPSAGVREVLRQLSLPQLPIAPLNSQGPVPLSALIKQASLSKAASATAAAAAAQQQQAGQAGQMVQGGPSLQSNWPRLEIAPLAARPSAEEAGNVEAGGAAGAKRKAAEVLAGEHGLVDGRSVSFRARPAPFSFVWTLFCGRDRA